MDVISITAVYRCSKKKKKQIKQKKKKKIQKNH